MKLFYFKDFISIKQVNFKELHCIYFDELE